MTTQAAVAAQPAANGSAAGTSAAAVKEEASPAPSDAKAAAAAAAAGAGAADGARRSGSPAVAAPSGDASARATPDTAAAAGAAGAADAAPSKEDEEQRKLEDEILAEGQAIAGVRALLAKAFSRPAEEPAVPLGHWGFLLREMQWLANDMAQERLWKQAAAMAIAYEVARMRGKFKLKPPPEGQRQYHDELAALRAAAAKEAGGEKAGGRRSASKAAAADATAAAALKLDPEDDPIWRDIEEYSKELELPATPPTDDLGKALALTWQHDAEFQAALEAQLMRSDVERMMKEEMAAREYRFEYEAALASHHMAVQEQNRRAMRLDADMADAEGLLPMDEDEADDEVGGKKAKARKRARSGYLLDDLASVGAPPDETDSVPKGGPKGPGRQFIEDTYLQRKRRRERYKDVDVDYDVGMETAGRYGTRGNRQMATRAGASRAQDPNKRKQQLGGEAYGGVGGGGGQGAMARHGAVRPTHPQAAVPGPVIWSKPEDDLLLAITHEFGVNWTMVSEVLSLSLSMQGIFRPPHLCKQRFRQITTPLLQQQAQQQAPPGTEVPPVDYSEDKALMALYMAMSKQQARELIVMSLPVHDDVMMRMLEALVQVGATAKQRRQLEEKRNEVRKIAEPHPSHGTVHQLVMAKTGNKHLTPMELAVQVDVAYAQQAKQHQMLAQQAQQAAQLQAQAAPPPPGQQAAAAAAAAAAAPPPQGAAPGAQQGQQAAQQAAQQQAGGPSPAVQGMPAHSGAPGVAAGTPAGAPGMAAQQQQAAQQQGMPSSATPPLPAGLPGSAGTPGAAGMPAPGQGAPSPVGAPGQAPAPRPQQQQITLQQLNHILDTGKLPNGQPLEPQMRKAIEDKKNAYLAQMAAVQQRQMMMMQQQQAGGAPGGAPGQAPSAAQAAMQAAQQAAAVQAGMRPAMQMGGAPMFRPGLPPGAGGMPGMQAGMPPGAGMPGQPMGMQMMGAPGMGMQPMQPGMQQMSAAAAAQQQAIMQQFAMQQQAQMAAAAQAQPGAQPPGA